MTRSSPTAVDVAPQVRIERPGAVAARDAGRVDHLVPDPDVLDTAVARAGELAGRRPSFSGR